MWRKAGRKEGWREGEREGGIKISEVGIETVDGGKEETERGEMEEREEKY